MEGACAVAQALSRQKCGADSAPRVTSTDGGQPNLETFQAGLQTWRTCVQEVQTFWTLGHALRG